jgi:hypothetical protein
MEEAALDGEEDYLEIIQYNDTMPRCGECKDHIDDIVGKVNNFKEVK